MEQFSSLMAIFLYLNILSVRSLELYCFLSLDLCGVFGGIQAER